MNELEQAGANTYYINCPAKIGVYLDGVDAYLIDSGSDKDAGRKIRQIFDKNGWNLKAVFNTHSNADHIGGNKYLQGQTDCKIYARGIERDFTEHPILEPSFLYGGYPCKELRHKFLLAQESEADYLDESVLPDGIKMLPLPGHFFDMVGFRTADNVVFLADCLSSSETLEKYKMIFEKILKKLFDDFGLKMNFEQYVLVGSTVRSYLAWLKDEGKLSAEFKENSLLWRTI